MSVEARLLGATVGQGWDVMGELLASVRSGLVIVDGEEELSGLASAIFPGRPVQRCLWHLARGTYRSARYSDKASHELSSDLVAQVDALLSEAYRSHDLYGAQLAYAEVIDFPAVPTAALTRGKLGRRRPLLSWRSNRRSREEST